LVEGVLEEEEVWGLEKEYLTLARWQAEGAIAVRHTTTVCVIFGINDNFIG